MSRRLLPLLLVLVAVTGCSGAAAEGEATLWVTRDRGATLLVEAKVPAGLTAMQGLEREAEVDTGYGGRFVESIEGLASDAGARRDWFYFVNGVEADRGAAEYRLRAGDVLWWDYRSWSGEDMRQPVVVGAFPEPFLSGYAGKKRRAFVRYASKEMRGAAWGLANTIGARSVELSGVPVPESGNVLEIVREKVTFTARLRTPGAEAGSPVVFRISFEDAKRLLADPTRAWRRYEGLG